MRREGASIYRVFCQGEILLTDAASAEMAKLVENAYRDVNIAFANELSLICESLKLDVWEVIELANHHPRVNILTPGPGVGGHCIAVDPWFIVGAAPELSRLIRTAREVNDRKPDHVAGQVIAKAQRFREPTIACLGLAFKANVDDLRESPAVDIVQQICAGLPERRRPRRRAVRQRAAARAGRHRRTCSSPAQRRHRPCRHRRRARRPRPVPGAQPEPPGRQGRLRHSRALALTTRPSSPAVV